MNVPVKDSRTALLLGEEGMARLMGACVAVFGMGGVGGFACEALARAGVGRLWGAGGGDSGAAAAELLADLRQHLLGG